MSFQSHEAMFWDRTRALRVLLGSTDTDTLIWIITKLNNNLLKKKVNDKTKEEYVNLRLSGYFEEKKLETDTTLNWNKRYYTARQQGIYIATGVLGVCCVDGTRVTHGVLLIPCCA